MVTSPNVQGKMFSLKNKAIPDQEKKQPPSTPTWSMIGVTPTSSIRGARLKTKTFECDGVEKSRS